jgi:type II secretory pathway pseudopilin PulG
MLIAGTKTRKTYPQTQAITLVELLVVFSIISIIAGMGMALWSHSGKQMGFQALRGEINSLVQLAQSSARLDKRNVTVTIDPARKEIYYIVKRPFGLWHCEDITPEGVTTGSFNFNARLSGSAAIVSGGWIGGGLLLDYDGASSSYAEITGIPLLDRADGLVMEVAVYPYMSMTNTDKTIVEKSGAYSIIFGAANFISVEFGQTTISTTFNAIPYERWSSILASYEPAVYGSSQSSGRLSLFINNQYVNDINNITKPDSADGPVTIGSRQGDSSFFGIVDELKFSGLIRSDPIKLEQSDLVMTIELQDGTVNPLAEPHSFIFNKEGFLTSVFRGDILVTSQPVKLTFSSGALRDNFEIAVK